MGSKGKKGDICLDEGEEGIGNEEESVEHLPRIYFTFSVKTIKREPPINRASPRDYECLHLQKRKKKKKGKEISSERKKKKFGNSGYDKVFCKFKISNEIFRRIFTRFRASKCILEIVHDSPRMFYQNTLWYRRRFKGDGTMFTECRGTDGRKGVSRHATCRSLVQTLSSC